MSSGFNRARALGTVGALAASLASIYIFKGVQFRRAGGKTVEIVHPPAPGEPEFTRLIETLSQAPQRPGNRVTILRNGQEIFPALLEGIYSAERSISFSAYIWWAGRAATDIGEALAARARDGIQVRVLLDAWGSAKLDRAVVEMLEEAGAEVYWFRPLHWYQPGKSNNRMHRRVMVVDGRVAFAGGVGIAEQWEGNCEQPDQWRETHVRFEGPVVRDVLGGFLENWAETTGKVSSDELATELEAFAEGVPVMVLRSSPTGGSSSTETLFLAAIAGARKRLWITTAYFAPRAGFVDQLCFAATRGVDVRVLVNGREIDKEVVRKAGQHSYGRLLEAGVRIFEYEKARLHAKVIVVDERWANVGSANFDNRSFALEEEMNVAIEDPSIAAELAGHFLDDLSTSREIDLQSWQTRPFWDRTQELAGELIRQSL